MALSCDVCTLPTLPNTRLEAQSNNRVLTHNVTPELCMIYLVRLTLTISSPMDGVSTLMLTHNVTPKLCTEYFIRLILTNLDWVSTVRGHTTLPLSCVDTQCYP